MNRRRSSPEVRVLVTGSTLFGVVSIALFAAAIWTGGHRWQYALTGVLAVAISSLFLVGAIGAAVANSGTQSHHKTRLRGGARK